MTEYYLGKEVSVNIPALTSVILNETVAEGGLVKPGRLKRTWYMGEGDPSASR